MKKKLSIFLFFVYQILSAQDPFYINYSTSEGLPSATVYSVYQDDQKFLWFTTDSGVVKYDSHSFTLYNTDNGLSDNEVFQMKKDHQGRIWFLTLNGKPSYFYKGKIYNENNASFLKQIASSNMIMDYYQDTGKNGYFIFRYNTVAVLKSDGKVEKMALPPGSFFGGWKAGNDFFVISDTGVYNLKTGALLFQADRKFYYRMYHFSNRNYFSQLESLYEVRPGNQIEKIITLPEVTEIINVFPENEKRLWLCTRNGVYLYENKKLQKFFSNYAISSMTRDFEGGYWLTTLKNGVLYVPSFEVYEKQINSTGTLKLSCISINDKKEIWIGSEKDEYYVKKPGADFITYRVPRLVFHENEVSNIRFFEGNTYLANKSILVKISPDKQFTYYLLSVNDLLIDDKNIYLGAGTSYRLPRKKAAILDRYKVVNKTLLTGLGRYEFMQKRITIFCKGENDEVWAGSNFGLYHSPNGTANAEFLGKNEEKLQSAIQDLLYDAPHKLLFAASSSKGLLLVKNRKVIQQFSKVNGLNSNSCNSIKKLPKNSYLIGSNNGLNMLTIADGRYRIMNLNAILGLKNKKINGIEFMDGRVYLIADKSLLYFDLESINRKKTLPICHIENLRANDTIVKKTSRYCFSYENNDISINYIGISYIDQNLKYYYRLGQGKNWASTNETQINYKSLAPGKYRFQVYCADDFSVKSRIQQISFEIEPPYWQETWFIIIAFIVFALLLYGFIRYRLRLQRQRFETEKAAIQTERDKANLEKQMIDLEQKALRLQMNPHFIFNALNTIKGYYSEGNTIKASSYISKFSKLLRMLLENTDQSVSLDNEIEMLDLYIGLAQTRYKDKFEYKLYIDPKLSRNETAIPTLLLQPIVENAIIHGLAPKEGAGLLQVSFLKRKNQLQCIIEDNGIGREASQINQKSSKGYQSKAIEITKERIALFSENLDTASFEIIDLHNNSLPTGTKVIITIPLISIW